MSRFTVAISLALGLLMAAPASADSAKYEQRMAQVLAHAGAPVDSVGYRGTYDWEPLGDHSLLLWETRRRAYFVDVEPLCDEMPWAQSIVVDFQNLMLHSRFDKILVRGRSCRIYEIRPVDVKGLQAERKVNKNS